MENSGNQEVSFRSIVDDVVLDHERAHALAELRPQATQARLFREELESIEDGVNKSTGRRWAGVLGDIGQISSRSCSAKADSR